MTTQPDVSVVISCFNYERFVADAVHSALGQTGARTEVIVVDDGSEDASREVLAGFDRRIRLVAKANGGQASALNRGFAESHGDAIIFLDADDVLLPSAAGEVAAAVRPASVAKAHWPMPVIDGGGNQTGEVQDPEPVEGDLHDCVVRDGPLGDMTMPNPPMSGNAFARRFLERVMPMPEDLYRTAADEYLFGLAPAFGRIVRLAPQSLYRIHDANDHAGWSFERMLAFQSTHAELIIATAARAVQAAGESVDEEAWSRATWWLRARRAVDAIDQALPPRATFALIDGGLLGVDSELRGREAVPFPDRDGEFAGEPADDAAALTELGRLEARGIRHVAVLWPAFWWMEEYPSLAEALNERYRPLVDTPDLQLFSSAPR
jgi:glycosyltransferase involved in cell wall biosynthesis